MGLSLRQLVILGEQLLKSFSYFCQNIIFFWILLTAFSIISLFQGLQSSQDRKAII